MVNALGLLGTEEKMCCASQGNFGTTATVVFGRQLLVTKYRSVLMIVKDGHMAPRNRAIPLL